MSGTGRKTIDSFFKQLEEDSDFRSYVGSLSGSEIALLLVTNDEGDVDVSEIGTRLWLSFPEKPYAEILSFIRTWNATEHCHLDGATESLDPDQLAAILDPDKAVVTLRFYNMGILQAVQVPVSGSSLIEVILERGDAPKVSEKREGSERRLGELLVKAAQNQKTKAVKRMW